MKKFIAECAGTAALVFFGCGTALVTGDIVAISLAFGLVLLLLIFIIGPITGCHVNPAVSLAFAVSKKISWKDFGIYLGAQFTGGVVGAILLLLIRQDVGFGANVASGVLLQDGDFTFWTAIFVLAIEIILTLVFVLTILVTTSKKEHSAIAPFAIGLALVLVHIIGISLTGTSVNPARSFGPALLNIFFGDTEPFKQVILFLVGPAVGGVLAALVFGLINKEEKEEECDCECCHECAEVEEKHEVVAEKHEEVVQPEVKKTTKPRATKKAVSTETE
jgi:aquaporin Z